MIKEASGYNKGKQSKKSQLLLLFFFKAALCCRFEPLVYLIF